MPRPTMMYFALNMSQHLKLGEVTNEAVRVPQPTGLALLREAALLLLALLLVLGLDDEAAAGRRALDDVHGLRDDADLLEVGAEPNQALEERALLDDVQPPLRVEELDLGDGVVNALLIEDLLQDSLAHVQHVLQVLVAHVRAALDADLQFEREGHLVLHSIG